MNGSHPAPAVNDGYPAPAGLDRIRDRALAIGAPAAALTLAGVFFDREQFFRSYLVAFLFWLGIALGCLALAMLHHLTGGGWGLVVRRVLEAASRTLPLMAVLFVPILLGMRHVYVWARPEVVAADALLRHKAAYLNPGAFAARAALYFTVTGAVAYLLSRWSLAQDRTGDPALDRRMRLLSAPGLALHCLAVTFLAIDWLMSLEPRWTSSIYGVYLVGGQSLSALAFVILVARFLAGGEPMVRVITARHFNDYGNLLLAFLMLWAYFSVSQLIIIWSGNLPEEIPWYVARLGSGWQGVGLVLVLVHFALPFLLLLSRTVKQRPGLLVWVAGVVLAMRWVDLYWQAAPVFHPERVTLHWLDLAAPVAMGGIWVPAFVRELKRRSLVPVHAPALGEVLRHA